MNEAEPFDWKERFQRALQLLNNRRSQSLRNAIDELTGIVEDVHTRSAQRAGLWMRGKCRQRLALKAASLDEAISLQRLAATDRNAAVETDPDWFAQEMLANEWFPQHPAFLPAYRHMLKSRSKRVAAALPAITEAMHAMGAETGGMAAPSSSIEHTESAKRRELVEYALRSYSMREGVGGSTPGFADDLLSRSEDELRQLLDDELDGVREVAICALRFTTQRPSATTLHKLWECAGPEEKRSRIRGQSLLTLAHFASSQAFDERSVERFISRLIDCLENDTASGVQAIAAELLAKLGGRREYVVASLVAKANTTSNPYLLWALIRALAACGFAAREALPTILKASPRPGDFSDDIVRATAILYMIDPAAGSHKDALKVILTAVRWQPTNQPTPSTRHRRCLAMEALCDAPMDEKLRCKYLLDRLFFDESKSMRTMALNAIQSIDESLMDTISYWPN